MQDGDKKREIDATIRYEESALELDKSNYKMVVAAFETKTGKKVETVGETK